MGNGRRAHEDYRRCVGRGPARRLVIQPRQSRAINIDWQALLAFRATSTRAMASERLSDEAWRIAKQ